MSLFRGTAGTRTLEWLLVAGAIFARGRTAQPPDAVPEFGALARALRAAQGVDLGTPAAPDSSSPTLTHFQRFRAGPDRPASSFESHADGTVYLAYAPATAPAWYDVARAEDSDERREQAVRTAGGASRFSELKRRNVDPGLWRSAARAFPRGGGPAPRWLSFRLPLYDPCATDRAHLSALEADLRRPKPGGAAGLIREVERRIRLLEVDHLMRHLRTPQCRPQRIADWPALLSEGAAGSIDRLLPPETGPLEHAGDYCFRDVVSAIDPFKSGPPSWQTILPENTVSGGRELDNGQRKLDPDQPAGARGNRFVYWNDIRTLVWSDPARARRILRWGGQPTRETIKDHPIPWLSSTLEGVVTNSFLSGSDYAGNHVDPPEGYWLGASAAVDWEQCGILNAQHALCNDWEVFVKPDPEYRFLLAHDDGQPGAEMGWGNLGAELHGDLENEVEQWLIPAGFRPEPGDRIQMTGRWVIDCGHEDWHAELHPIEAFVSAHLQGAETVASVVVTGDWPGGDLDLDVWPPPRPSAAAALAWRRQGAPQVAQELTVVERPEPADDPNHLRLRIVSVGPRRPLHTEDWNQVVPHLTRRLAVKYRLWWR